MPAAPAFLPPAPTVPEAVLAAERDIIAEEGRHHVNNLYFSTDADAARARRFEAERRVAAFERSQRWCPWCSHPFDAHDERVLLGGRNIHKTCYVEYGEFTRGASAPERCPDCGSHTNNGEGVRCGECAA